MSVHTTTGMEFFATICFFLAILHTFSVKKFQQLARRYAPGSVGENFLHLLGEVEVVFGFWGAIFLVLLALTHGTADAVRYLETRDFKEPAFVFVVLVICSTRPILSLAERTIGFTSQLFPIAPPLAFYLVCLILGPLMGSFITEPAAMTVTALILLDRFFSQRISTKLKYATLGLLFVNVSIGGTLTPYAAPPVLMVASKWGWGLGDMLTHFGWKAAIAIIASTVLTTYRFREEISKLTWIANEKNLPQVPLWVQTSHVFFLALVVMNTHHTAVFVGIFLFFLGWVKVTQEYQTEIKLREGLLVAFFLGGLVVLGGPQRWWLEPVLSRLDAFPLYLGSILLTAITDNAALTYLGAQVPTLSIAARYALVAGSVVGGGLTVIANAPNPVGYGILNVSFGKDGMSPWRLLTHAALPTGIAAFCFWIL